MNNKGNLSNIFGGAYMPPKKIIKSPENQLLDAIMATDLEPPSEVILDGRIHRFGKNKSSWYVAFGDTIPAGRFGDWKLGLDCIFKGESDRDLTTVEQIAITNRIKEAKLKRDEEEKKRRDVAADTVDSIWSSGALATAEHPYLKRKGIQAHGTRITGDGRLMIPLYFDDEIASIQYIQADGEKRYHTGGRTGGCYLVLGEVSDTVYITEGFATAATIHEVTGAQVYVAFSASNLPAATEKAKESGKSLVVVADNDASGVGKSYADQASAKHGARVVMPPEIGMDANDYHQAGHDLFELLIPKKTEWLVAADEYCKQPAPISWMIKGWVQDQSLMMVHGPSGGGKTFLALDWLLSIAAGLPEWHGHKIRQQNVVYLCGEGHHGLRSRIAAWKQRHPTADLSRFLISKTGCDLNTPEGYALVVQSIRDIDIEVGIVGVDTLHRFMNGDENSAQDAKTMIDACNGIMKEFTCSTLLVHHTGVSEEAQHRARGSSAWRGALDIEVSVVPSKGDKPIEIVQRKSKDAELSQSVFLKLERQDIDGWFDEDNEPVSSAVLAKADAPERDDGKLRSAKKMFEAMWHESGCDLFCDAPYVSNAFAKDAFERMNHSASTAKKYSLGSDGKGPLAKLKEAGILRKDSSGWIAEDSQFILALKG